MSLLWVNGQLVDKSDARVSPFDHGFLYGDGVWEHLRVFGGKLFRPGRAVSMLQSSAAALEINVPLSAAELIAAIETAVRANNRTDGYIRMIVTRGPGTIGPDPRKVDPQVIITAEEYQPFPIELYGHGLHVAVAPVRIDLANPALRVRSLGRPDVVSAKRHALRSGCLEAVVLDTAGSVVGGTEGKVFVVRGGIVTRVSASGLDVTGDAVKEQARTSESVQIVSPADLIGADEVFLAGVACGVIGIVRVDGTDVGSGVEGPVTRAVREEYRALSRGESGSETTTGL